tara:strand:+ start:999 stop:1379 length:381 start_codon:yes stop_codon:yes gene_type:complete
MKSADELEVEALMERYFDGLYHSDSEVLRTVFHPKLAYINASEGNHEFMDIEAYMTRIDNREPPAKRGENRSESVDRVKLISRQMGLVEARMTMMGRDYQDLLTLIHTDAGWQVLTKVFAYQEKEG